MTISTVGTSQPSHTPAVQTLVASQQEAQKEAQANIQDGDESLGANVNKLA